MNYIFCYLEFVVCFAPLSHKITDTPTRRVCLCEVPHGSVVGAAKFHDLGTLQQRLESVQKPRLAISEITNK